MEAVWGLPQFSVAARCIIAFLSSVGGFIYWDLVSITRLVSVGLSSYQVLKKSDLEYVMLNLVSRDECRNMVFTKLRTSSAFFTPPLNL